MRIDINGCVDSDVHAICIRKGNDFLAVDAGRNPYWTGDIESSACFLTESRALDCLAELQSVFDVEGADLIWTDSRLSIYADIDALRRFEEQLSR